jgi:hypothetical protein
MHPSHSIPQAPPLPRAATRWMRLYLAGTLAFLAVLHLGLMFNLYDFVNNIF